MLKSPLASVLKYFKKMSLFFHIGSNLPKNVPNTILSIFSFVDRADIKQPLVDNVICRELLFNLKKEAI